MPLAVVRSRVGPPINGLLFSSPGEPAGAVIVLHEWWGLNEQMKGFATRLAGEGFLTLALDLYGGRVAADATEARALSQEMKTLEAMAQVQAAVDWIAGEPICNGKVGVTGFCLGGGQALAAACNVGGLSAVVPFYGLPLAQHADWSRVTAPIQGHYAEQDTHVNMARLPEIEAALQARNVPATFYRYPAGHAFMRENDPTAYHAESAALAWTRMLGFLREQLA